MINTETSYTDRTVFRFVPLGYELKEICGTLDEYDMRLLERERDKYPKIQNKKDRQVLNMIEKELKNIVVEVCEKNFCFAPLKKNIVIIEGSKDGYHIKFRVNSNNKTYIEYRIFGSRINRIVHLNQSE